MAALVAALVHPDSSGVTAEGMIGEIDRDLTRTFPLHPDFALAPAPAADRGGASGAPAAGAAGASSSPGGGAVSGAPKSLPVSPASTGSALPGDAQGASPDTGRRGSAAAGGTATSAAGGAFFGRLRPRDLPPGLARLRRILLGFCIARPEVGYCQGMNYVAAAVYVMLRGCGHGGGADRAAAASASQQLPAATARAAAHTALPTAAPPAATADDPRLEVATLQVLLGLSDYYACAEVWMAGLPRLRYFAAQLGEQLRRHVPLLHEHLERIGFQYEVLAAQWMLPLGTTILPLCSLRRVWDLFLAEGWKALFRVVIGVLRRVEGRMLDMDAGDVSRFFRVWKEAVGTATARPPRRPAPRCCASTPSWR
jgi:hypothetical protein